MNDGLSDNIKKKFMLQLTIEPRDPKEKVFPNTPVFPAFLLWRCLHVKLICLLLLLSK